MPEFAYAVELGLRAGTWRGWTGESDEALPIGTEAPPSGAQGAVGGRQADGAQNVAATLVGAIPSRTRVAGQFKRWGGLDFAGSRLYRLIVSRAGGFAGAERADFIEVTPATAAAVRVRQDLSTRNDNTIIGGFAGLASGNVVWGHVAAGYIYAIEYTPTADGNGSSTIRGRGFGAVDGFVLLGDVLVALAGGVAYRLPSAQSLSFVSGVATGLPSGGTWTDLCPGSDNTRFLVCGKAGTDQVVYEVAWDAATSTFSSEHVYTVTGLSGDIDGIAWQSPSDDDTAYVTAGANLYTVELARSTAPTPGTGGTAPAALTTAEIATGGGWGADTRAAWQRGRGRAYRRGTTRTIRSFLPDGTLGTAVSISNIATAATDRIVPTSDVVLVQSGTIIGVWGVSDANFEGESLSLGVVGGVPRYTGSRTARGVPLQAAVRVGDDLYLFHNDRTVWRITDYANRGLTAPVAFGSTTFVVADACPAPDNRGIYLLEGTRLHEAAIGADALTTTHVGNIAGSNYTGIAYPGSGETVYLVASDGKAYSMAVGALVPKNEYRGGVGIVDVSLPEAAVDGTSAIRVQVAVQPDEFQNFLQAQGPIPVHVRTLMRADGAATWELVPTVWSGVLGASGLVDGVWSGEAEVAAQTPRYAARYGRWSHLDQLQRTGGADTALRRLRSTRIPRRTPNRMGTQ